MNFVPRPVMKSHSSHEDSRPLPGYESNKRSKWDSLSPGGVAEVHPGVAGRRSQVLMAENRGQLAKTQNSMRESSLTTRYGRMQNKSIDAIALLHKVTIM